MESTPTPPETTARGYHYETAAAAHTAAYLWPAVERVLTETVSAGGRVFDLGCGNGAFAARVHGIGYQVSGVDPSHDGITLARSAWPGLDLSEGSAYEPLCDRFGTYEAVVSLEVVEHIYAPRAYAATLFDLVEPGGVAVVSTPYHGYAKNLALALTGKLDAHFTVLWDHGHIKFWSERTLSVLLEEAGFAPPTFLRVGRVPLLAKSMIAVAHRP